MDNVLFLGFSSSWFWLPQNDTVMKTFCTTPTPPPSWPLFPTYVGQNVFLPSRFCPVLPVQVIIWNLVSSPPSVCHQNENSLKNISLTGTWTICTNSFWGIWQKCVFQKSTTDQIHKKRREWSPKSSIFKIIFRHPLCTLKLESHCPMVRAMYYSKWGFLSPDPSDLQRRPHIKLWCSNMIEWESKKKKGQK